MFKPNAFVKSQTKEVYTVKEIQAVRASQFERDLDGAVLTSKMIFATDAVRQQYNADPAVIEHLRLRNEHNAANGIISRTHFE